MATVTAVIPAVASTATAHLEDNFIQAVVDARAETLRATGPVLKGPFVTGVAATDIFPPIGSLSEGAVTAVAVVGGTMLRPAVVDRGVIAVAVLGLSSIGFSTRVGIEAVAALGGTLRVVRGLPAGNRGVSALAVLSSLSASLFVHNAGAALRPGVFGELSPVPLGGFQWLSVEASFPQNACFSGAILGGQLRLATYQALPREFPEESGRAAFPWLVYAPDVSAREDLFGTTLGIQRIVHAEFLGWTGDDPTGWTVSESGTATITKGLATNGSVVFATAAALTDVASLTQLGVVTPGLEYELHYEVLANTSDAVGSGPNLHLTFGGALTAISLPTTVGRHVFSGVPDGSLIRIKTASGGAAESHVVELGYLRIFRVKGQLRKVRPLGEPFLVSQSYTPADGDGLKELGARPGSIGMLVTVPLGAGTQDRYLFREPGVNEVVMRKGQWS